MQLCINIIAGTPIVYNFLFNLNCYSSNYYINGEALLIKMLSNNNSDIGNFLMCLNYF